jgi:hypothetical protein
LRINIEKVQDEVRKLGTVLIAAGSVGFALEGKVSAQVALFAILAGIALIFLGAMSLNETEEAQDAE